MKVISLFSGAGGLDLGFIDAGVDIVWANDHDKDCSETYSNNLGSHIVRGDILQIKSSEIPKCDGVIGGPPCQGFSTAGKMDPNDPRSKLVWEFIRVVQDKKPLFFVMENVPNLVLNSKFSELKEQILKRFDSIGYSTALKILNAKDYNVPQARERAIFIGVLKKKNLDPLILFPEVCNDMCSVRDALLAIPNDVRVACGFCNAKIVPAKKPVLRKSPYAGMLFNGQGRPLDLSKPSITLTASMGGNKTPFIDEHHLSNKSSKCWVQQYHKKLMRGEPPISKIPSFLRRITVVEAKILQSFPLNFQFYGSQCSQYRQIGNSVPPQLSYAIAKSIISKLR